MTVTETNDDATREACSEWEHCAFSAGHAGICRDITGEPDPDQLGHEVEATRPVVAAVPNPAHAAIDAAARAALDQPGIPGRDEFLSLCMQARVLSMSALAPKALRDKPHDMLMILLVGRDLQIPTTSAIKQVYVVDGQPSLAPKLLNARIRRLGLGRIMPHPDNGPGWAAAIPLGPTGEELGPPVVFTWEDAQRAGLVRMDCRPDEHSDECVRLSKDEDWKKRKRACKDNYVHWPQRMCWWRACGNCADDYYPEASLGVYSPDELGALTDADGNLVDVDSVEIPAGFERKAVGSGGGSSEPPAPASDEDRAELRRRIGALPEEGQQAVRDAVLATRDREGVEPLGSIDKFPARQLPRWKATVEAVERRAKAGEWGAWEPPADPTTGEVPNGPSTPDEPPGSALEAPDAATPPTAEEEPPATDTPPPAPEASTSLVEPSEGQPGGDADPREAMLDEVIALVREMPASKVLAELVRRAIEPPTTADRDEQRAERQRVLAERLFRERTGELAAP